MHPWCPETCTAQTLSVSETLHLAARLSLPAKTSKASRAARCHQTLATMGLLGVQHHKVHILNKVVVLAQQLTGPATPALPAACFHGTIP